MPHNYRLKLGGGLEVNPGARKAVTRSTSAEGFLPQVMTSFFALPFKARSAIAARGALMLVQKVHFEDAIAVNGTDHTALSAAITAAAALTTPLKIVLLRHDITLGADVTMSSDVILMSDNGAKIIAGAGTTILMPSYSEVRGIHFDGVKVNFVSSTQQALVRVIACRFENNPTWGVCDVGTADNTIHAWGKIFWNEFVNCGYATYFNRSQYMHVAFNKLTGTRGVGHAFFAVFTRRSIFEYNWIKGAIVGIVWLLDRTMWGGPRDNIIQGNYIEDISDEGISFDAYANSATKLTAVDRMPVESVSGSPGSSPSVICARDAVVRNITSITRASNVVTVTMDEATNGDVGESIIVAGVTDSSFNGTFTITARTGSNTVQWAQTGSNATSSGGTTSVGSSNSSLNGSNGNTLVLALTGAARGKAWRVVSVNTDVGAGKVRIQLATNSITATDLAALTGAQISVGIFAHRNVVVNNYLKNVFAPLVGWGAVQECVFARNIIDNPGDRFVVNITTVGGINSSAAQIAIGSTTGGLCIAGGGRNRVYSNKVINDNTALGAAIVFDGQAYSSEAGVTPFTEPLPNYASGNNVPVFVGKWENKVQGQAWVSTEDAAELIDEGDAYSDEMMFDWANSEQPPYERALLDAKEQGRATFSGTGSATTFSIPHGLGIAPRIVNVTAQSAGAAGFTHVAVSSTALVVTYSAAPPSGTNNVVFTWSAEV